MCAQARTDAHSPRTDAHTSLYTIKGNVVSYVFIRRADDHGRSVNRVFH